MARGDAGKAGQAGKARLFFRHRLTRIRADHFSRPLTYVRSRSQGTQGERHGHYLRPACGETGNQVKLHRLWESNTNNSCTVRCEECDRNADLSQFRTPSLMPLLSVLCGLCERQVLFPHAHSPVSDRIVRATEPSERFIYLRCHTLGRLLQCMACDPA